MHLHRHCGGELYICVCTGCVNDTYVFVAEDLPCYYLEDSTQETNANAQAACESNNAQLIAESDNLANRLGIE